MKKTGFKIGLLWILWMVLAVRIMYFMRGESLILFWFDLKYSFTAHESGMRNLIIIISVITVFCIYIFLSSKRILWIQWEIRFGKKWFTLRGGGNLFQSHLILLIGISLMLCLAGFYIAYETEKQDYDEWCEFHTVAHARGSIDNYSYTNCLEAIELNYEKGQRVFEIDFSTTSDNRLVCRHDWELDYQEGIDAEHVPTEAEFVSIPILGQYTPLTLEMLLQLMKEKEDMWIVTDSKEVNGAEVHDQYQILLKTAEETDSVEVLDRFVVQLYNDNMLRVVNEVYEFEYIYTLYQVWKGDPAEFLRFCRFCKGNNVRYITMNYERLTPEIMAIAKGCGIGVFVHTVNDLEYSRNLIADGVLGVYTDDLTPDMLRGN